MNQWWLTSDSLDADLSCFLPYRLLKISSKIQNIGWLQSQVHTIISQVPVSHQVYDHLGAQPLVFRQPQAITSIHRLKHVTMVHAGNGKKKTHTHTRNAHRLPDSHQKDPAWEVNHFLEAFEAKEAWGAPAHNPGFQETCQLSHPGAGWMGCWQGPSETDSKLP